MSHDLSRAIVIQMTDLPGELRTGPHLVEFLDSDPVPRAGISIPVFRYIGPCLDDQMIAFLAGMVATDIRRRMRKSVNRFTPREGQDPDEAAAVLAKFEAGVEFRRSVLARLADLTWDPGAWHASAADELPDDYESDERECSRCGDQVQYLSSRNLCDGCEAEEDT